ncbi:MAG: AbrB/MazE/SpoVT family DNA-binding domain-containing protein [Deltaproteobacteria bacterium]|nr:AbrB/MazE/SpoVT family DNA-binding domain-containing protein [Deltaproteobacteria bacterium]MBW2106206.1 AbrB/MazE/SpoVT family DNA-binding domain-containing protein [Deltaproteobacteria bacterium]MBW2333311.1 AbrB/MazE/SpoVT family DNA-binding domain-containing protein [Deltaproteobacteria bacterium]MCD6264460.1 AbrB/MazE/SpoVT family DNA-binding domain-containing protein [Deltaproteobacteria bacterium]HDH86662.1 AbrB/MazE/SpoVT family DNA-binding domain-containing protein [Desulfobacterace
MSVVTTSSRGQIVIPRDVRKQLQIVPGKKVLIRAEGDRAILFPLPDDPVDHFCGIFQKGTSLTRALLAERGKERAREAKKIT